MTDTTETNENIETVEYPEPRPHHLFEENLEHARIHHMAQTWSGDVEELKESLWYFRRAHQNAQNNLEQYRVEVSHMRARISGMQTIADRDKTALRKALEQIHGDTPKVLMEWNGWATYLRIAFYIGIMTGHHSEAHRLAFAIKEDGEVEGAEDIWDEVSRSLRTPEGTYPNPVPGDQAAGMAWREYGYRLTVEVHPADPRLDDGWRKLWMLAKTEGLCEVFDTLADNFGVPQPEITRSGTVTVRFSGSIDIPVEGWDGEDIWEAIDDDDVRQAIRYDGYIDMDDIDTSDMSWD